MAPAATILYLPGIDEGTALPARLSEHLPGHLRLEVFSYPTVHAPRWDEFLGLVHARLKRAGSGLLLGESFGGAVAQRAALAYPNDVQRLFLLSTFNHEPERFAAGIGRVVTHWLPGPLFRLAGRALLVSKLASQLKGEERRKYLKHVDAMDLRHIGLRLDLLKGFDTRPALKDLRLPVRVVVGARDPICAGPEQLEPWRHLPNGHLEVVADATHFVGLEKPDLVAAQIVQWLEQP